MEYRYKYLYKHSYADTGMDLDTDNGSRLILEDCFQYQMFYQYLVLINTDTDTRILNCINTDIDTNVDTNKRRY